MTHPADFADACRRHWEDAELLFAKNRWANADQLYGLSAECGLKAAMQTLEMDVDTIGRPQAPEYRKHVQELWPTFYIFAEKRGGSRYLRLLPRNRPFADWSHHDRYAHRCHFHKTVVEPHRKAAWKIREMV